MPAQLHHNLHRLAVMLLLAAGAFGIRAAADTYTIDSWTVSGGADNLTGGNFSITPGIAGQPDAGVLTGSSYTLYGGFIGPDFTRNSVQNCWQLYE